MDIIKLLNEMERMIENRRSFMGVTYGVDHDLFLDLLHKIRASLPEEVKRASRVTAESEKIVDGARETAEQTLEDAGAEADQISREARINAERMLRETEAQANKITMTAETNARQTLEDARLRAEKMLAEAHGQAEKLISQNEVIRLATAQAREIVAAGEYESHELRHGADQYAQGVMVDLEQHVSEILTTVQRGRGKLDQRVAIVPAPVNGATANGRTADLAAARR